MGTCSAASSSSGWVKGYLYIRLSGWSANEQQSDFLFEVNSTVCCPGAGIHSDLLHTINNIQLIFLKNIFRHQENSKLFILKYFISQNKGHINKKKESACSMSMPHSACYINRGKKQWSWRDAQACRVAHCPGKAFCPRETSQQSNQIIPTETAAKYLP